MDYNLNLAYCIKEAHSWGHDTFYNICKGTKEIILWGSLDWTWAILGASVITIASAAVLTLATAMAVGLYLEIKDTQTYNI